MIKEIKKVAIIGPTASGKSDLAIAIAKKMNAYILSIDSLSIYKEIDIVSAKPSNSELHSVPHFGINALYPNEYFSVDIFINIYKNVLATCKQENKNLVIVGGTSFYLKSLIQGLSELPKINQELSLRVKHEITDLDKAYALLQKIDPHYMKNISISDSYRIEKALLIYRASACAPSDWFTKNPPKSIIKKLSIYNIDVSREVLRERIAKRTHKMFDLGLVDEVCMLERKYTRLPHAMKSIGIVEVLDYLDGKYTKEEMLERISIHTGQLAKRQQTFNKTQFENITSAPLDDLEEIILGQYNN
ncbi:tRNA (adenosine(37)-N6)-dimethylallyltransferase MiaA [Sulfurimonas sp. SAG-AH-194-I05]|nr:tRNA (adenosine(37)-N6)-dimethylallyltransferase MiaA [Sulfurimonas sp. SAG-AH-194-I05]MDF1875512.1 tRNA (adenosine(37)-N6)-dimethylallyltransferase MiaA [Sulfurimonas sp. SAG-AH-194-I05]